MPKFLGEVGINFDDLCGISGQSEGALAGFCLVRPARSVEHHAQSLSTTISACDVHCSCREGAREFAPRSQLN